MPISALRPALAPTLILLIILLTACSASSNTPPPQQQQAEQQAAEQQPQPAPTEQPQPPARQQQAAPTRQQEQQQAQQRAAPAQAEQQQIAQPSAPQTQQQTQQQVQQQTTQQQPQPDLPADLRVVVLFGDLTEIVYALGAGHVIVGRDASSIYPPEAELLPNLGFNQELSAEGVLSLEPTLVIGSPTAGPPEVLEQIRGAGVEVVIIEDLYTFDAPALKIRAIGTALGLEQRAETLIADVEARIDAVLRDVAARYAETQQRPSVLFLYVRRNAPQLVAGEDSPAAAMIEAAGGADAGTRSGIYGFAPLTPEAVVAADPDALLVMRRGVESLGGVESLRDVPGIAQTRAWRDRRVIVMDDLYLLGFGPRLPEALADLAAEIHRLTEE